jgi:hypothetical protein
VSVKYKAHPNPQRGANLKPDRLGEQEDKKMESQDQEEASSWKETSKWFPINANLQR